MQKRAKACRALKKATASDVQIHAAAEAIINAEIIYPRLRVGGDLVGYLLHGARVNFNPRLRVGGDEEQIKTSIDLTGISIHASAWEATDPRGISM